MARVLITRDLTVLQAHPAFVL